MEAAEEMLWLALVLSSECVRNVAAMCPDFLNP